MLAECLVCADKPVWVLVCENGHDYACVDHREELEELAEYLTKKGKWSMLKKRE